MRIAVSVFLFALILSSCISPKKAAERYQPRIDSLDSLARVQEDSIRGLTLALERSWGSNDALVATQGRLQDRLAQQDDQIEELERTLSNTSDELSEQVSRLRAQLSGNNERVDSLLRTQSRAIGQFSKTMRQVAARLSDSLGMKLDSMDYEVTESPGSVTLSVHEMVIFRPRSVGYLAKGNEEVLKLVARILQENPLLKLRIVGHTDNQPNPLRGTDNWRYGAMRATTLANELTDEYYVSPNRIIAASQGEYGPTRSNATEEGRYRNRRMDFEFFNNVGNLLRELDKLADIRE
jgi:flagellar motor protein MotB